jgi:hypothetical protein
MVGFAGALMRRSARPQILQEKRVKAVSVWMRGSTWRRQISAFRNASSSSTADSLTSTYHDLGRPSVPSLHR